MILTSSNCALTVLQAHSGGHPLRHYAIAGIHVTADEIDIDDIYALLNRVRGAYDWTLIVWEDFIDAACYEYVDTLRMGPAAFNAFIERSLELDVPNWSPGVLNVLEQHCWSHIERRFGKAAWWPTQPHRWREGIEWKG